MSYIHEALRKAQREKDLLADKGGRRWSTHRYRPRIFRPEWVVSVGLVVIAVVFLSRSWSNSVNQGPLPNRGEPVRQAALKPSDGLDASKARETPSHKVASNPQGSSGLREKTDEPSPGPGKEKNKEQQVQETVKTKPQTDETNALYRQALALQKEGRLKEGKRLYEEALEHSPHLVSALNNLGTIHIKEKDYPAAGRAFEKAIRIEPGYVDPYYNLACLHALQDDVGRSLFYLKKAISIDSGVRKWARADKDLQKLHGHSEYERIIQAPQGS
jgi:tetratricopeptide (TPR) repeat protein